MPKTIKKVFGKIHLWLGLLSGLVVFISLSAAALFVWEKELTDWYHHKKVFVPQVTTNLLSVSVLQQNASQADGGRPMNSLEIDKNPQRAYKFINYKMNKKPGWTWFSDREYYNYIYVDQYTGKVLGVVDLRYDWIFCTRMLHQSLLLARNPGHYIVGFATLIIFIMIISGIVLWWPKNKAALKQRIWFKWKKTTRWKRKNYDLHNIGGIYTFLFILFFAITGLVWTFEWWTNGIYRLLGSSPEKVYAEPPAPKQAATTNPDALDRIVTDAKTKIRNWDFIYISIPKGRSDSAQQVEVGINYSSGKSGWDESDEYTYNSQTGQPYFSVTHDQKTLAAKWRNSNYQIHTGSIYGLPTKILATIISLFCALLPVSGFLIWWGRKKKAKIPATAEKKATLKNHSVDTQNNKQSTGY